MSSLPWRRHGMLRAVQCRLKAVCWGRSSRVDTGLKDTNPYSFLLPWSILFPQRFFAWSSEHSPYSPQVTTERAIGFVEDLPVLSFPKTDQTIFRSSVDVWETVYPSCSCNLLAITELLNSMWPPLLTIYKREESITPTELCGVETTPTPFISLYWIPPFWS